MAIQTLASVANALFHYMYVGGLYFPFRRVTVFPLDPYLYGVTSDTQGYYGDPWDYVCLRDISRHHVFRLGSLIGLRSDGAVRLT